MRARSNSVKNSVRLRSGLAGSRSPVRANKRMCVAFCALVFQTFRPLTTKRSPCLTARVWMREVSVPTFGSVTPNDITISPLAIFGRYFRLSRSEPCLMTGIGGNT